MVEVCLLCELQHLASLGEVARQGLLAGDAPKGGSALHRLTDGAHMVEAGIVGTQDPDGVHLFCSDEILYRTVGSARPKAHRVGSLSQCLTVGAGRAKDPAHLDIADPSPGVDAPRSEP
jgi:hypothetical protein